MGEDEELVVVYESGGGVSNANFIRSVLAGNGIDSAVQANMISAIYPVNVGDLGSFRILVRAEDADAAFEILQSDLSDQEAEEEDDSEP